MLETVIGRTLPFCENVTSPAPRVEPTGVWFAVGASPRSMYGVAMCEVSTLTNASVEVSGLLTVFPLPSTNAQPIPS